MSEKSRKYWWLSENYHSYRKKALLFCLRFTSSVTLWYWLLEISCSLTFFVRLTSAWIQALPHRANDVTVNVLVQFTFLLGAGHPTPGGPGRWGRGQKAAPALSSTTDTRMRETPVTWSSIKLILRKTKEKLQVCSAVSIVLVARLPPQSSW